MTKIKSLFVMILCIVLLIPCIFVSAQSDPSKDVSLTVSYVDGETPVTDAEFSIYLVASADEYGALTVCDEFTEYKEKILNATSEDGWDSLSDLVYTLESFVLYNSLTPADSGKTDVNGDLTFPTSNTNLKHGLYLCISENCETNGILYDCAPFLILLPTADRNNNEWVYDVTAVAKFTKNTLPENEKISKKVLKIWHDDGNAQLRPESITVYLIKNGEVYDTVKLTAEGNWRHTWDALDAKASWTVAEEVPDGYAQILTVEGSTFVITNTLKGTPPDGGETDEPDEPNLPQTGLLWWPVIMLLTLGLLFVVIGLVIRRKSARN